MRSIRDGELFERTLDTSVGSIDVLAEVVIDGSTIELRDIAVYPRASARLTVPAPELLRQIRSTLQDLADAGFDRARITGTRLSGSAPGRTLDITIHLRQEDS